MDASLKKGTTYTGNLEPNSVNGITLPPSTVARFVRIHAVEWQASGSSFPPGHVHDPSAELAGRFADGKLVEMGHCDFPAKVENDGGNLFRF